MSERITLMEALARYRQLTTAQSGYYRDVNFVIRIYCLVLPFYPLFIIGLMYMLPYSDSGDRGICIAGALCTTLLLYRVTSLLKERRGFEEEFGLRAHRRAIRKFNLQKL